MSVDPKRWMFYNCPKDHAWIVYQNLKSITEDTTYIPHIVDFEVPKLTSANQLIYLHGIDMSTKKLVALLETKDGFYLIHNIKEELEEPEKAKVDQIKVDDGEIEEILPPQEPKITIKLTSLTYFYPTLMEFLKLAPKHLKASLYIGRKLKNMTVTATQKKLRCLPYDYGLVGANRSQLLKEQLADNQGILDLKYNFAITAEDLQAFVPTNLVKGLHTLILNSNFAVRNFNWCKNPWAQGLSKVELINLPQFIDSSLEKLLDDLPNLKHLHVHFCPQVTIKCMKGLLKKDQLEVLAFNNPLMACQHNTYTSLLPEEDWDLMGNRSIQKIMLNSSNLSLDIIYDIKRTCHGLKALILDDKIFNYLRQNLTENLGDVVHQPLQVLNMKGHRITIGRDCAIQNQFRHNFQKPFSNSMASIIEKVRSLEDQGLDSSDSDSDSNSE